MATRDPRIDAYIEKAQPFAQPILKAGPGPCRRILETAARALPTARHP